MQHLKWSTTQLKHQYNCRFENRNTSPMEGKHRPLFKGGVNLAQRLPNCSFFSTVHSIVSLGKRCCISQTRVSLVAVAAAASTTLWFYLNQSTNYSRVHPRPPLLPRGKLWFSTSIHLSHFNCGTFQLILTNIFGWVGWKTVRKKVAAIKFLADKWREESRCWTTSTSSLCGRNIALHRSVTLHCNISYCTVLL